MILILIIFFFLHLLSLQTKLNANYSQGYERDVNDKGEMGSGVIIERKQVEIGRDGVVINIQVCRGSVDVVQMRQLPDHTKKVSSSPNRIVVDCKHRFLKLKI